MGYIRVTDEGEFGVFVAGDLLPLAKKIRSSGDYSYAVYNALTNSKWNFRDGQQYSISWEGAADLVCAIREFGDRGSYMDRGREGEVLTEVRRDMEELGFVLDQGQTHHNDPVGDVDQYSTPETINDSYFQNVLRQHYDNRKKGFYVGTSSVPQKGEMLTKDRMSETVVRLNRPWFGEEPLDVKSHLREVLRKDDGRSTHVMIRTSVVKELLQRIEELEFEGGRE